MNPLILTLIAPLIGSVAMLFIDKKAKRGFEQGALWVSLCTFALSLAAYAAFDSSNAGYQLTTSLPWIHSLDIGFRTGVDGMSMIMVLLTTLIFPVAILTSMDSIKERFKEYYAMVLLLEFGTLGVFISMDAFLFYVFWEVILIPMYFIIGIWGGKDRIYAAVKFFIYTMVGSLMMLIAIIWLGIEAKNVSGQFTADMLKLRDIAQGIDLDVQKLLFLAFALSFCIKVPLFPVHTWLPDAHVQAPTAGSVILAGVLLKLGTYGLIRFNLDFFPQSSIYYADFISTLAVIGIVYGGLVAFVQTDVKKLVAYSSVSHMGFIVLGIFSMTTEGIQGAIIQMVNHGLSTGMLFLAVGVIYERRHTRELSEFGGLARVMPGFSVMLGIAMFASVGLPGLNGFVGEYLTLIGAFTSNVLSSQWFAIIAASGVIVAAAYLLKMYQGVVFGSNDNPENHGLQDLTAREWTMLLPLAALCIILGMFPTPFLNISEQSTQKLVKVVATHTTTAKAPAVSVNGATDASAKTTKINNQ